MEALFAQAPTPELYRKFQFLLILTAFVSLTTLIMIFLAPPGLRQESVEEGTPSAKTKLIREKFLKAKLTRELNRSTSLGEEMVLVLLGCDGLKNSGDPPRDLKKTFPPGNILFKYGTKGATVIFPNGNSNAVTNHCETLRGNLKKRSSDYFTFRAGMSARNDRLMMAEDLLKEAMSAYRRASQDEEDAIFLFKADPEKFRQALSERN